MGELFAGTELRSALTMRCNRIEEFIDDVIEQRQRAIAAEKGFEMTDHSLYIYGICRHCQKTK